MMIRTICDAELLEVGAVFLECGREEGLFENRDPRETRVLGS